MKKLILLNLFILFGAFTMFAQTIEELKAQKAQQEEIKKGVDAKIADLNKQIKEFPGWTYGAGALFGLDFAGQSNWFAVNNPNTRSNQFGIGFNAYANKNEDKYYWRNDLAANWARGEVSTLTVAGGRDSLSTDIAVGDLGLTSRGGYYLYEQLVAVSGRANWNTVIFDFSPGSITLGLGVSVTPSKALEFWVHPLAYQINYPGDDFTSATGASFGGSYTGTLYKNIKWNSTLEGFFSYQGDDDEGLEASDLHNWTWRNGFVIDNLFKGIGVGLNVSLRSNKQLARAVGIPEADWGDLQVLYNLGFTYSISN